MLYAVGLVDAVLLGVLARRCIRRCFSSPHLERRLRDMTAPGWYGIVEFNVPLDTV